MLFILKLAWLVANACFLRLPVSTEELSYKMELEILVGGALAMVVVAYGFATILVQSMQAIPVISMVGSEGYLTAAVCIGIVSISAIFALGE